MDTDGEPPAIERLRDYLAGRRSDLEPGDLDKVMAELDRRGEIERRAREVRGASHERSSLVAGYILTGER